VPDLAELSAADLLDLAEKLLRLRNYILSPALTEAASDLEGRIAEILTGLASAEACPRCREQAAVEAELRPFYVALDRDEHAAALSLLERAEAAHDGHPECVRARMMLDFEQRLGPAAALGEEVGEWAAAPRRSALRNEAGEEVRLYSDGSWAFRSDGEVCDPRPNDLEADGPPLGDLWIVVAVDLPDAAA
jgi:predicted transcriptional regulator